MKTELPPTSIRKRLKFAPEHTVDVNNPSLWPFVPTELAVNIIIPAKLPNQKWMESTLRSLGSWRDAFRSAYMRWAIAINALHLAEDRYRSFDQNQLFEIKSYRVVRGIPTETPIAQWSGKEAAQNHKDTAYLMAAYGVVDMYGVLEEVVFDAFRIWYNHHPLKLLEGEIYKDIRKLYNNSLSSPELIPEWQEVWNQRLIEWQKNNTHQGLHKTFTAYFAKTGLKRPSTYKNTDIADWANMIRAIGELRNLIMHGATNVSKDLSQRCVKGKTLTFDFVEGDIIDVQKHHLASVECFCDQILTTLNLSIIEKMGYYTGNLKSKPKKRK